MGNYLGADYWNGNDAEETLRKRSRTKSSLSILSSTVLNPNANLNDNDEGIISAIRRKKGDSVSSQSEFEYLQSIFPHVRNKEDIAALYDTNSQMMESTCSTAASSYHSNYQVTIAGDGDTDNNNNHLHSRLLTASTGTAGASHLTQFQSNSSGHNMYDRYPNPSNLSQSKISKFNESININNNNTSIYYNDNSSISVPQYRSNGNTFNGREGQMDLSMHSIDGPRASYYSAGNFSGDRVAKISDHERHDEAGGIRKTTTQSQNKKIKKKRKKKKKKGEYRALGREPDEVSYGRKIHRRSISRSESHETTNCCCECLSTLFYVLVALISVCLIFGSLFVDVMMAIHVYWPHGIFIKLYFIPSVIAIGLTLISYFVNSCCFFVHTDYCGWAGSFAPVFRCLLSLPPFGVIYTLMLIPGVHSLPFHMAAALCQYGLNMTFMMTNTEDITMWNWIQLCVGSGFLLLSPMFAWLQQSNQGNLRCFDYLKLMLLWLMSISPLTILELINIFPVLIENFTYNNLDIRTFVTLILWSALIRMIFAFIFVDEDGSRLSLICFKRLGVYDSQNDQHRKSKRKKKRKRQRPWWYCCSCTFRALGQLILQIFYLALPLLPTAAATVRLYKKSCIEYAKWNHLCVAVYLVFTYLPMLYLLLGNEEPGPYTEYTIAIAYVCSIWVLLFLPTMLRKWVDFKW